MPFERPALVRATGWPESFSLPPNAARCFVSFRGKDRIKRDESIPCISLARSLVISDLGRIQPDADDYPLGPDSQLQPGVPKGEVLKFSFDQSKIFPGTYRDYWIYVPAQYKAAQPACLYVNQDGIQW